MSSAPSSALSRRHAAIRQSIAERQLDALVVTSMANILYLTNFTGSSAIVVMMEDQVIFVTDFRYVTALQEARAANACPDLDLVTVEGSYDATLAGVLAALPARRVGFEASNLTVGRYDWLSHALPHGRESGPELIATDGIVERARVIKDQYEIETLREAARRLSAVARGVVDEVRIGRRERDVALAIDFRLRREGFEKAAFDTIVAGGPNAALPHAHPGERTFAEGDLVVLDFGGVYDSYCVDLTRTVSVGRASTRAREVYGAVLEAHDRAIGAVAPGRSRFEIDGVARSVLASHGLAEAFGHGTGHGLGIDVHEEPRITRPRPGEESAPGRDPKTDAVAAGMVFTIEPGAYLAGWGGVRIEDDVLVTDRGVEVLTDVPTDLIEV
ncbi:MAG TPA: Xaa-Pro peptidase family protein [Vicinamibacterales bacterium]|nr:Xaa-Pro peptidase family protein [Vicinamibacterales bacterium]